MKVAIVADWLVTYAGAERVLEQMLHVYPDADLFSVVDFLPQGERGFIRDKPVQTSFIQRLPLAEKRYRQLGVGRLRVRVSTCAAERDGGLARRARLR